MQKEITSTIAEKIPPMCAPVKARLHASALNRPVIPISPKSLKDWPMEDRSNWGSC
jgi:hypothetical protein